MLSDDEGRLRGATSIFGHGPNSRQFFTTRKTFWKHTFCEVVTSHRKANGVDSDLVRKTGSRRLFGRETYPEFRAKSFTPPRGATATR